MVKTMSYKKIIIFAALIVAVVAVVLRIVHKPSATRDVENITISTEGVNFIGDDGKPTQLSVDVIKFNKSDGTLYSSNDVKIWIE